MRKALILLLLLLLLLSACGEKGGGDHPEETAQALISALKEDARTFYEEREKMMEDMHVDMREVERVMLLRSVPPHLHQTRAHSSGG